MDTNSNSSIITTAACACDDHELCLACLDPELALRLQLKMSLVWARTPLEVRERTGARDHLAAIAPNN